MEALSSIPFRLAKWAAILLPRAAESLLSSLGKRGHMELSINVPKPNGRGTKLVRIHIELNIVSPLLSSSPFALQGITIESGYLKDETCMRPRVQMLRQGSVGKRTGLMSGDIVTHVDGTPVSTHLEATTLIQKADTVSACGVYDIGLLVCVQCVCSVRAVCVRCACGVRAVCMRCACSVCACSVHAVLRACDSGSSYSV